ncbi:diguanylate cyclase domain-containing protein [Lyngbya sp. PCC 8106]|uniref:diguanylate cyclase domain-containing protein n=1 Tax=Lyngbya sp. (strain PCC 8106) TaxID=313612 RepID=UPI0000EA973C|nr:diguanylate cyclase [Lyngbya sp. PCC 8106]EAW34232.1 regulatory component of sensory transduction system [Lyngbya sp. PCC 8106]
MIDSNDKSILGSILIVDDSLEHLNFLAEMLNSYGYLTIKAENAEIARIKTEYHNPDLILLDIILPEVDGYKFCQSLKYHPNTSDIPIIFMSDLDELFDKIKAFKVGGVDYIPKPFQVEEVVARVENQLALKRQKIQLTQEIERRQQVEEILCESRSLLASVLNSSPDGIAAFKAVRDQTGKIAYFRCVVANPRFAKLIGQPPNSLVGQRVLKSMIDKLDHTLFEQLVQVVEMGETLNQEFRFNIHHTQNWYQITAVKNGEGFAVTIRDISEGKEWEMLLNETSQNIYQQAISDSLTQIGNRRAFDHYLQQEWHRAKREQLVLSLILADIDYFKSYNDHYGHQAGDECLRQIAQAIHDAVKRPADFVARYGGEEFAVILPNTDIEGAKLVAELIHSQIHQLQLPHPQSTVCPFITLSQGVSACVPQPEDSLKMLIARTDGALYQAKEQGRDRIVEG